MYSYILVICHYALNTFSALPKLPNRLILANTYIKNQFSPLLVNLCENVQECRWIFGIHLFSAIENWCMCGSDFTIIQSNLPTYSFSYGHIHTQPHIITWTSHSNSYSHFHSNSRLDSYQYSHSLTLSIICIWIEELITKRNKFKK